MDSSGDDSEGGGQLWLTPKLSRVAAGEARPPLTPEAPAAPKAPAEHKAPRASTSSEAPAETQPRARRPSQAAKRALPKQMQRLSAVQSAAWYAPRILLLFLIGWSWSVGIRFIHAPQQTVAGVEPGRPAYVPAQQQQPVYIPAQQQQPVSRAGKGATADYDEDDEGRAALTVGGDYDSSDSDDSDNDGLSRWRGAGSSGPERGAGRDARVPRRDAIARVLATASWSGAIGGLMTVVVGLGYPFLDCKWQCQPRHAVAWNDVLRCAGGFLGVNYAALKLPFESAHQSSAIMLIIALGLWTVCDGTLHGLLLSASASLSATWLLYMHALGHYGSFSQDDYLGLLATLPNIFFTYWVMVGSVGRRLGPHPQWRRV